MRAVVFMRAVVIHAEHTHKPDPRQAFIAGSLNTFGRNEIEVAPISSGLLCVACLVILYKTLGYQDRYDGVSGLV